MYRIEEILKSKNISKSEFARLLGIQKQGVQSLLKGNPTKARLEEMAKVLGVPTWQLFVSPAEVSSSSSSGNSDFIALIKSGKELYSSSSIDETIDLLHEIKQQAD